MNKARMRRKIAARARYANRYGIRSVRSKPGQWVLEASIGLIEIAKKQHIDSKHTGGPMVYEAPGD